MINFFIDQALSILDWFFVNLHISDLFDKINELLTYLETYKSTWDSLMQGIFFICGKNLVVFGIGVGVVIIVCSSVMAIVNLIGQFVP